MLILVTVTINFALNGGIITKAKQASSQMQIEADREALLSCVIASMGLDGKVDFTELDKEVAKIGFTGTSGTYTSKTGNTFTVDSDGNIVSEGEPSDAGADLTYLKTYIGSNFLDIMDENTSGLLFKDPNIVVDAEKMMEMGSMESDSEGKSTYPILYKGKSYSFILVAGENDKPIISDVIENNSNNSNEDLIYLRKLAGKYVTEIATVDTTTGAVTFNDSTITTAKSYDGNPITDDGIIIIPIEYKGKEFSH